MNPEIIAILGAVKLHRGRNGKELNYPLVRRAMEEAALCSPTCTVTLAELAAARISVGWKRYLAFLTRSKGAPFTPCYEGRNITGYRLRPATQSTNTQNQELVVSPT